MSNFVHPVSDQTFDQDVLKHEFPVLVDFWAEWCGPCRAIAPLIEEVAQKYAGKIKVVKLNVDENQELPPRFGIRGIPTLILFKDGNAVATQVGAIPLQQLEQLIELHI